MRTTPHQSNANPLAFRLLLALVGCGADLPAAERALGPLKRKPQIHYRGAQQELPGSPTRTTGVPDKNYRGAQQVALSKIAAKRGFLRRVFWPLCFCLSCSVMLLKQQLQGEWGGSLWEQITSS